MTLQRLNPLEKRSVNRLMDRVDRPWDARLFFRALLALGLLIIGWGVYRVASGLGAWESAISSGYYSWLPGAFAVIAGVVVVLLAVGVSGKSQERRVMASALRKLRNSH